MSGRLAIAIELGGRLPNAFALVLRLVYAPDDLVLVVNIQWIGE
jgi:hypothetical protein